MVREHFQQMMVDIKLLFWKCLNFFYLQIHKKEAIIACGISEKAIKLFQYGQEDGYWNKAKVVNQI